jgi:hypothetical protein
VAVQFDTPAHEEGFRVVEDYLVALGFRYRRAADRPYFSIPFKDDVVVHLVVRTWGEDDAVVILRSWIVRSPALDTPLLRFLLERNHLQRFGMLAVDVDGDILVQHALSGNAIDQLELDDAIQAVAVSSLRLRAEIIEHFGGEAF